MHQGVNEVGGGRRRVKCHQLTTHLPFKRPACEQKEVPRDLESVSVHALARERAIEKQLNRQLSASPFGAEDGPITLSCLGIGASLISTLFSFRARLPSVTVYV